MRGRRRLLHAVGSASTAALIVLAASTGCTTAPSEGSAPVEVKPATVPLHPRTVDYASACPQGCNTPPPVDPPKPCEELNGPLSSTIKCDGLSRVATYCPAVTDLENITAADPEYQEGSISLCWYDQAHKYCCYGGSGPKDPARYNVDWYGTGPGADKTKVCACGMGSTCNDLGFCQTALPDAGAPTNCAPPATYPPTVNEDTGRQSLGYDVPTATASWACTQLSAIPYVGQALFTPNGGLGLTVDAQLINKTEWKPTCREELSNTIGAGITANICSLRAEGRWDRTTKTALQHCVNCDPPPTRCGGIACIEESEAQTRQITVTKNFSIPLGSPGNGECSDNPPQSRWIQWILEHVNVSASVGGGWNGNSTTTNRLPGTASCPQSCGACQTDTDRNNVFLQASGEVSVSTPSWAGVEGSAYVRLTGRAGLGREDQTSSCTPACGGYNASASITLRLGVSVGAFGYSVAQSVGYTCQWAQTWSTCPNPGNLNTSECRWANPTDP